MREMRLTREGAPHDIGRHGERVIAEIAEANGALVVGRNLRVGHAEVDLLIVSKGVTWAIEVKSARADSMAAAELHERLDHRQLARVRRAAGLHAMRTGLPTPVRMLAALVVFTPADGVSVEWVEELDDARYSGK